MHDNNNKKEGEEDKKRKWKITLVRVRRIGKEGDEGKWERGQRKTGVSWRKLEIMRKGNCDEGMW